MIGSTVHITPTDYESMEDGWDLPLASEEEYLVMANPSGHRLWL